MDIVDICLHNNLHSQVAVDAFRQGVHVYCEKPLAGSYVDGKEMIDAARETGKILHVQLSEIYSPETRAAKRLVEGNALGRLYHARSVGFRRRNRPYIDGYGSKQFVQKRYSGGGAIYDMGVYHISRLLYLMGTPEVHTISGQLYQRTEMDEARRQKSGYDVEEFGCGFVRLSDDMTLEIAESWAIHLSNMGTSYLVGDMGGLQFDPFSFHTTHCDIEFDCTADITEINNRWLSTNQNEWAYASSQNHLIAVLRDEIKPLDTAELALRTMLIQEGLQISDQEKREITVDEVAARSKTCKNIIK